MSPGAAALDHDADAEPAFAAAAERHGRTDLHLRLAGRAVDLRTTGDLAEAVGPALHHLVVDGPAPADALRWRLWEDEQHRHPLWDPVAPDAYQLPDGGLVARGEQDDFVECFRPDHGIEVWGPPGRLHEVDHTVAPAGRALQAWAAATGLHLLHLGAVAHDGAAALLVGASGAGKTTTVLACEQRGDRVLGDDTCLVDGAARTVHSLHATVAVTDDTLARTGRAAPADDRRTITGKRVLALDPPQGLTPSAPIAAVVVLRPQVGHAAPTLAPLADAAAARALVTSTLVPGVAPGHVRPWFAEAISLARSLPTFELTRGDDLDQVVDCVHHAIDEGRGR